MVVSPQGILRPQPKDFVKSMKAWFYPARKPSDKLAEFLSLPSIPDTFATLRDVMSVYSVS